MFHVRLMVARKQKSTVLPKRLLFQPLLEFFTNFRNSHIMQQTTTIAATVLAAGRSSRMGEGRHKLLLPLGERTVLEHVLATVLTSEARPLIVVLGHQAATVREHIGRFIARPHVHVVENAHYTQGMSTSLYAGLQALLAYEQQGDRGAACAGALVVLGDQPFMSAQVIDSLIEAHRQTEKRIVAPLYGGKRGNPVLFERSLFPELLRVSGDEGARSVIERHRSELLTLEMEDTRTSADVDTWEAYQDAIRLWQEQEQG